MVIAVTGGGSGALSALLQTPGASRSILEAIIPYSFASLVDWIGGKPDQACSEPTARAMAMAAFTRARLLAPDADVDALIGVGCTASLTTDRPKRGQRRVHVAAQTSGSTHSYSLLLDNLPADRAQDELRAAALLLYQVAEICWGHAPQLWQALSVGENRAQLNSDAATASPVERGLVLGHQSFAILDHRSVRLDGETLPRALLPGAFNPPHAGHVRMAEIAERRLGTPVLWEVSVTNVDKPSLDYISTRDRIAALNQLPTRRLIALTAAPTFLKKAELFPGATFIVGVDTIERIANPRYYGDDAAKRDAAISEIARRGCRFLVFGRERNGKFIAVSELALPATLRSLCDEVPASEFREDISSTALRTARLAPDE